MRYLDSMRLLSLERNKYKAYVLNFRLAIMLIGLLIILLPNIHILTITNVSTGNQMFFLVLKGETISLSWTHSLEGVPIMEMFEVGRNRLNLTKVEINHFIPTPYCEGDFKYANGLWTAKYSNKNVEVLKVRIGTKAELRLNFRNSEISLTDLGKPKELIEIRSITVLLFITDFTKRYYVRFLV